MAVGSVTNQDRRTQDQGTDVEGTHHTGKNKGAGSSQGASGSQKANQTNSTQSDPCACIETDFSAALINLQNAKEDHKATMENKASTQCSGQAGYPKDPLADLKNDPEYKAILERISLLEMLDAGGFDSIDLNFGGALWSGLGDHLIDLGNIKEAAAKGNPAAKKLMEHPELWSLLDKNGDQLLSAGEVRNALAELREQKHNMEDAARAKASPPPPPPGQSTPPPTSTETKPAQGTDPELLKKIDNQTQLPEPSKMKGLEGAAENMNNMLGWSENEIDRLSALYAQTTDPAAQKVIENKINQMTRRMQQISNMLNQIMTMLSNISKMQSDIAMNSIRNMR